MGPLSWVILGALIGGLTFCLFKIRAWAQSLAIFKGKRIYVYLKIVRGILRAIIKDADDTNIDADDIMEVSDEELYQMYLDGKITWEQYIAMRNGEEILYDIKYP